MPCLVVLPVLAIYDLPPKPVNRAHCLHRPLDQRGRDAAKPLSLPFLLDCLPHLGHPCNAKFQGGVGGWCPCLLPRCGSQESKSLPACPPPSAHGETRQPTAQCRTKPFMLMAWHISGIVPWSPHITKFMTKIPLALSKLPEYSVMLCPLHEMAVVISAKRPFLFWHSTISHAVPEEARATSSREQESALALGLSSRELPVSLSMSSGISPTTRALLLRMNLVIL
mmetsp:Transcript_934/g.2884  ORF Transcript_934/g.2884 Transcript_934/m.2884 type:complete len:225 (-) Transcript_934:2336-3010(-)